MRRGLILLLLLLPLSSAYFPQEHPANPASFDYYVTSPTATLYLISLYDNTTVFYDTVANGILTTWLTMNKSDTITTSSLPISARIHADKPVMVYEKSEHAEVDNIVSGWARIWGNAGAAASRIMTDFHIPYPANTFYIIPTQSDTLLQIDENDDDTLEVNVSISIGNEYSYTYGAGTRVHATRPVAVKHRSEHVSEDRSAGFVLYNATGTDFYVGAPMQGSVYVLALSNDTDIFVDTDRDGSWEYTYTKEKNQVETLNAADIGPSTYIHTSKPALVSQEFYYQPNERAADLLPPANALAQSLIIPYPVYSTVDIAATKDNTELLIDKNRNGTWETNVTIQPGTTYSYSSEIQAGSLLRASRPIVAFARNQRAYESWFDGSEEDWTGQVINAAHVAATSTFSPSPADYSSLAYVNNTIWNMHETIINLTIAGSVPLNFTPYPNTTTLNITISKHYENGTQINQTETFSTNLSAQYDYTINFTDSALLEQLGKDQHVVFTYRVTTPPDTGTYIIPPYTITTKNTNVYTPLFP